MLLTESYSSRFDYSITLSLENRESPFSVTRASFTAVAVIVLSMVLAANHATLVPVFAQVGGII